MEVQGLEQRHTDSPKIDVAGASRAFQAGACHECFGLFRYSCWHSLLTCPAQLTNDINDRFDSAQRKSQKAVPAESH